MLKHLPALGIALALGLIVAATTYYPGGTMSSADTVGYSWANNTLSALFQPRALNGAPNPARSIAIPAMLFLCVSLGVMFKRISDKIASRAHRKTIEISGIGSAVYGLMVVTPMHDLMVTILLLFVLVAVIATLHALYLERRWMLVAWGSLCIALSLLDATIYYGNVFFGLLPVVSKLSLAVHIAWLLAVYYTLSAIRAPSPRTAAAMAP